MNNIRQTLTKVGFLTIALYRSVLGSMLVLFVPAVCGDHPCNPYENLVKGNGIYLAAVGLNFTAFMLFGLLSIIEFRREHWLNHYLLANPHIPIDSDTFFAKLDLLEDKRKDKLIWVNNLYIKCAYATLTVYISNVAFSSYVIFTEYRDNKTPVSLITNIFLLGYKFYDIYIIISADKNVYLSAYKRENVHYNDVNPDKMVTIVRTVIEN